MASRPKPQKCVHCLQHADDMSWDHVFPISWYPDTSPANEEKWKIPSCTQCNASYGRLEEDFKLRVALCLNPDDPAAAGIVTRAMRSIDPTWAKSGRDRKIRAAKRKRFIAELMVGPQIPRAATYPGMEEKSGRPLAEQVAVPIPQEYVQRMVEKIVRGLFFIEDGKLIEPPYEIEHFAVREAPASLLDALAKFGTVHARPPGLVVRRAVVPSDGLSSLFEILFWGQFKSHASVLAPH